MSRRREIYRVASPVTTDDLLRVMYGERRVPPLVVAETVIETAIWRGICWAIGLEVAAVALLLLAAAGWRALGGGTPW